MRFFKYLFAMMLVFPDASMSQSNSISPDSPALFFHTALTGLDDAGSLSNSMDWTRVSSNASTPSRVACRKSISSASDRICQAKSMVVNTVLMQSYDVPRCPTWSKHWEVRVCQVIQLERSTSATVALHVSCLSWFSLKQAPGFDPLSKDDEGASAR